MGPHPGLRRVAPAEYRSVRVPVWRPCIRAAPVAVAAHRADAFSRGDQRNE
jgi:hypothetical protein